jgi:sortase B
MIKVKTIQVVRIISALIFIGCALYIGNYYVERHKYQKGVEELSKLVNNAKNNKETDLPSNEADDKNQGDTNNKEEQSSNTEKKPEILAEYMELYKINPDFIGWLTIPNTIINYPVVQGGEEDFYLEHDFYKKPDKRGTLLLDEECDILKPTTNLMIHGHNMKDGTMFSALRNYKKKSFYDKNKIIEFNSIYEKGKYEIVSVFQSKVYSKRDKVFKYYQFYHASSEEEFNYFYENIKKIALYDTGVEANYGDTFITLSTCDYHTNDGRLAVVAKKIE